MRKPGPYAILALLAAAAFTLGTVLQPRAVAWSRGDDSGGLLQTLFGDGRRLFANHFFVQADVSFHSGYYPSVFDTAARPKDRRHLQQKEEEHDEHGDEEPGHDQHEPEDAGHEEHDHSDHATQHEKDMAFLREPRDWIERFGRRFMITEHKHLEGGEEREMLPWLRIAAELDPDQPETYTVAAYWLRDMRKSAEAERFLREGLRNIPQSYELYFELGRLYLEDRKDTQAAGNLWDLALTKWLAADKAGKKPDLLRLNEIAVHLAKLEESRGNTNRAIELLTLAMKATPNPEAVQKLIRELQAGGGRTPEAAPGTP